MSKGRRKETFYSFLLLLLIPLPLTLFLFKKKKDHLPKPLTPLLYS